MSETGVREPYLGKGKKIELGKEKNLPGALNNNNKGEEITTAEIRSRKPAEISTGGHYWNSPLLKSPETDQRD